MNTQPLHFGQHNKPGKPHSPAVQMGGQFFQTHAKSTGDKKHDALVQQTRKWVAQTFFGEMLKQMRNSPFKSKMFDGGEGGQAFSQLYDQQLADKMASGGGQKLVDGIVNYIEKNKTDGSVKHAEAKKAYAASAKPKKSSSIDIMPQIKTGVGGIR